MAKKPKYRVLYNKSAGLYKVQERCIFGIWKNLGTYSGGMWEVVYYNTLEKANEEKNIKITEDTRVSIGNWTPV